MNISNDKKEWLMKYAKYHNIDNNFIIDIPESTTTTTTTTTFDDSTTFDDFTLLPMAMKVAAKTISLDLVSVKPLSGPTGMLWGIPETESQKAERIREERRKKLERIFGNDENFI